MRVLALHPDVIVLISRVWQTTCTAIRGGGEGFVIDSPIYPDELDALRSVLDQAGFPVSGLLATHADWDHLLARATFPGAPLGCAPATVARLRADPGAPERDRLRFDQEHYVARQALPELGELQELPVPGRLELGTERELELHPAPGHTGDGVAVAIPWAGLLVCGDYLSPIEIPMIGAGGSAAKYRSTLERLSPLLDAAQTVVPGHGAPQPAAAARSTLEQDLAYLDALLAEREAAPLPPGRDSATQQRIHLQNVSSLEQNPS